MMLRPIAPRVSRVVAGVAAALTLFAMPVVRSADETESPTADSGLQEQVRVVLSHLDFLALDKRGNPVTDLRLDEVKLIDEGKEARLVDLLPAYERPVTAIGLEGEAPRFVEHVEEAATEHPAAADTPAGEDEVSPKLEAVPRWIVLFIDANNLSYQGRVRAGEALKELVDKHVLPDDRVSLMVDEDELRILAPFSTDRRLLMHHLENPEGLTTRARDIERRIQDMRDDAETCQDARTFQDRADCAQQATGSFLLETSRETERSLDHLEALLRTLASIPDRKILFYVSEGFVLDPGDVAAGAVEYAVGQVGYDISRMQNFVSRNYSYRMDSIYQLATESRTGIYPVNTMRKMNDQLFAPERRTDAGPSNTPQARTDPFEATWRQVSKTHSNLARATGGVALFQRDPAGKLGEVIDTAAGDYTLSYYPTDQRLGRRRLKLKVSRKGVRLYYQNQLKRLPREGRRLDGHLIVDTTPDGQARGMFRAKLEVAGATFHVAPESNPPASLASLYFELSDGNNKKVHDLFEVIAFPRGEKDRVVVGDLERPFALQVPPGDYTLRVEVRDVFGPGWGSFVESFSIGTDAADAGSSASNGEVLAARPGDSP